MNDPKRERVPSALYHISAVGHMTQRANAQVEAK
jgi:hypothetical protein